MVQTSMLPSALKKCAADLPSIAALVNRAQQNLVNAGGETGWFNGWQKVMFQVNRNFPYITLPREFARAINLDVCQFPIRIQNEFYEFLEAGVGLQGFHGVKCWQGALEGYERGVWPSMVDLTPTNQLLRVYYTDQRDIGKRILIGPAKDQNGNNIYTTDGNNPVTGFYMTIGQPFTTTNFIVTNFSATQKDATYGSVLLYQVDATTGAQVLLSSYAPDEIVPGYRRYFINRLPCSCRPHNPCLQHSGNQEAATVQVTAMVKLEFIPANRATDFLVIGNIPALIEECKAVMYSDMDDPTAAALEAKSHAKAIRLLQDEMRHYCGELMPAVNFAPFGVAKLERQRIGTMI